MTESSRDNKERIPSESSRFRGCLVGLAVGDAVGTTLEFETRGTFQEITDMEGGGPFGLKPGEWTDDTSMALCLGASLLHRQGSDSTDQMNRYCNWRELGYMSSNGKCFDIGSTVNAALDQYLVSSDPLSGSTHPDSAGNGSIMRLAPIPMYFHNDREAVERNARLSSKTTHGAEECLDACSLLAEVLRRALEGQDKAKVLAQLPQNLASVKVNDVANGAWKNKSRAEIFGTGYVVESLEAALWCFHTTSSYVECVLQAANLGDDADTTAAVTGQIAGAHYGLESIPSHWLEKLAKCTEIIEMADQLHQGRD